MNEQTMMEEVLNEEVIGGVCEMPNGNSNLLKTVVKYTLITGAVIGVGYAIKTGVSYIKGKRNKNMIEAEVISEEVVENDDKNNKR